MSAAGITPHRSPSTDYDRDDRSTVAVFSTVIAVVIAILLRGIRPALANPALQPAITLGMALFVAVSPFVAWRISLRGHYDEPLPWWQSQSTLTIAAVAIIVLGGMLERSMNLDLSLVIAVLGFLSAVVSIVLWVRHGRLLSNLIFLGGSAAFGVWAGCLVRIRYRGLGYGATDTLLPSPALWTIVIPFFFGAILLLAIELKKNWIGWSEVTERPLRTDYSAWFFFGAIVVGLIPTSGMDAMGIGNRNLMTVESHVIAVGLSFQLILTTMAWWRLKRTSSSIGDFVFLLAFMPFMLVSIGVMSPSLMLLLTIAGIGIALLGRLFRDGLMAASAAVCIALMGAIWVIMTRANHDQIAGSFAMASMGGAWWPYFFLINLFWSWLYSYLRVREEKLETVGAIRGAALEGRITDVVLVATVAFLSVGGRITVEVVGRGGTFATYASDLDRWLCLSLLMAAAWRWLSQLRKQREDSAPEGGRVGSIRISRIWIAALAIPIGVTVLLNVLRTTLSLRQ